MPTEQDPPCVWPPTHQDSVAPTDRGKQPSTTAVACRVALFQGRLKQQRLQHVLHAISISSASQVLKRNEHGSPDLVYKPFTLTSVLVWELLLSALTGAACLQGIPLDGAK